MKSKIMTLVLALSVVSWAQTATQTNPSTPQPGTTSSEKGKCPCCDKMSGTDMKDMHGCCSDHNAMAGEQKDMASHHTEMASCCDKKDASCCSGKDGASCVKEKDATGKGCCGDKCSKDKTVASCCGDQCKGDKCSKEGKSCCSSEKKSAKNCCADQSRG